MKKVKCFCLKNPEPVYCGDCGREDFPFNRDELEDIHSALSFFLDDYPDRKGSVHTRKAMAKIVKKIWKMKKVATPIA